MSQVIAYKGITNNSYNQRFLYKSVLQTQFCGKAFVVLRKSTIFALRKKKIDLWVKLDVTIDYTN